MKVSRILAAAAVTGLLGGTGVATAEASPAATHTYYVSTRGNDQNSGTTISRPFRHIQRCASLAAPGDTCFVLGGTYPETVTPRRSGTPSQPITFAAYHGQRVTISGADPVDGWQQVSAATLPSLADSSHDPFLLQSPFAQAVHDGHIYAAHVSLDPSLQGNEIFYGGTRMVPAQWPWPGADPLTPHLEYAKDGTTNTTIADPNLTRPSGYWNGAQIYTEYWFISQSGRVASSDPGSLHLADLADNGSCVGLLANSSRYYLFGQLKMLTHPNEWFYDTNSHTLYLWSPDGKAPTASSVQAKQRTDAVDLSQASNIHLTDLQVFGSTVETGDATAGDLLSHLTARYLSDYQELRPDPHPVNTDGCSILTAGETTSGIVLRGHGNALRNSSIAYSAGNGVALLGDHNTVTDNVIHDVDAMGSYAAGINLTGHDQNVTHNTIFRSGRSGINIDWHINGYNSHDNTVAYNDVSQFNRLNLDSAAMYACCQLDMTGTSIDHNWLHSPTPMPGVDPWAEAGLYLDSSSGNALVDDNVTWDDYVNNSGPGNPPAITPVGFFINGGGANKLYNNDGPVQGAYHPDLPNTVVNNIGSVYQPSGDEDESTINHNLPSDVDPQYISPRANDYRLRPTSPARNAGIPVAGITTGGTDAQPSPAQAPTSTELLNGRPEAGEPLDYRQPITKSAASMSPSERGYLARQIRPGQLMPAAHRKTQIQSSARDKEQGRDNRYDTS